MSLQILTGLFSYHQLNEARNTYFRRSNLGVVFDVLTPFLWDANVFIGYMIKRMLQHASNKSILRRHVEQSIARETSHSAGIPALLALFGPHCDLLAIFGGGCCLGALVHSHNGSALPEVFCPVSVE